MTFPAITQRLGPALTVFRAEGARAFRDRLLDRLESRRRRRLFRTVPVGSSSWRERSVAILNVLATPPRPDFGGIQLQLLCRLEEEAKHRPVALFYPDLGAYRLEVTTGKDRIASRITSESLGLALRQATEQIGAEALHVEGVSGLPLDHLIAGSPGHLVLSIHDFGLFCHRPHLIERPSYRFCNYSQDEQRCLACLRHSEPVADETLAWHRSSARELLTLADATLFPSDFLRRTHQDLFPGLSVDSWHVISPSIRSTSESREPSADGQAGPRVAFVGSVKTHKGGGLLPELVREQNLSSVQWSILGGGDPGLLRALRRMPNVKVRGYYRAHDLPDLLRRLQIDCALLPSIWPETYNMVLDDCLEAGVPVVAFDLGAPADRIRNWGGGVLVPLEEGSAGLALALQAALRGEAAPLDRASFPTAQGAAEEVLAVYRAIGLDLPE